MKIVPLSSSNMVNLYAGYGAEKWALPCDGTDKQRKTYLTKAINGKFVGKFAVFYCRETGKIHMPSVILSLPEHEDKMITELPVGTIWPDRWFGRFTIRPLVSPKNGILLAEAREMLKITSPTMLNGRYFSCADVDEDGWAALLATFLVH